MTNSQRQLTPLCAEMLTAVRAAGECVRYVRGGRWEVAGRAFHAFTGDALANRGLLEHFVREHDGNHYDRFQPVDAGDGEESGEAKR